MAEKTFVHPYIPNSAPDVKAEMMKAVGIEDLEELYSVIPEHLRFQRKARFAGTHDGGI